MQWAKDHRDKVKASYQRWYQKRGKNRELKIKYGIDLIHYHAMLALQANGCKICNESNPGRNYKALKYFQVDHDHKTGKIRGLLCNNCNRALGLFKDNADLCLRASAYLKAA